MADPTLRKLERRWRETGAVNDQAAWLRARCRAMTLTVERLRWAAACEHEAARQALRRDDQPPAPPLAHVTAQSTLTDLFVGADGPAACARVALATLSACEPLLARIPAEWTPCGACHDDYQPDPDDLLGRLRQVVTAGGHPPVFSEAIELSHAAESTPPEVYTASRTVIHACYVLGACRRQLVDASEWWSLDDGKDLLGCLQHAVRAASPAALTATLQREVAPWALGLSDPLRA